MIETANPGVFDLSFFVPGLPISQGSMRLVGRRTGRARVVHDKGAALVAWRRLVARAARQSTRQSFAHQAPVELALTFVLPRPSTVRRAEPATRPDLDKLIRAVLDAATGVLWVDDGQVVGIVARKVYEPRGGSWATYLAEPGVHVRAMGKMSVGPVVAKPARQATPRRLPARRR